MHEIKYWMAYNKLISFSLLMMIWTVPLIGQKGQSAIEAETRALGLIEQARVSANINIDSAMAFALESKNLLEQIESDTIKIQVLYNIGDMYQKSGDAALASEYYIEALLLADDLTEKYPSEGYPLLIKSDILIKMGVLNFMIENYEKTLSYLDDALALLEKPLSSVDQKIISARKLRLYNNIASVYLQQSDFETALAYYQNALEMNKLLGGDQEIEGSLANNIGLSYLEMRKHDLAGHYFLKALSIRTALGDMRGQAQVLNNTGKNEVYKGNFKQALEYYTKALEIGKDIGYKQSVKISLESLSTVLDTLQDYKKALMYYKEYKALNDSLYSADSKTAIAGIEENYKRERERKSRELELLRSEAEQQRTDIRNLTIGGILLILLATALLLLVLMRGRIKTAKLKEEKLSLEREKLELERSTLQESLDFKERELTAKALFLLKNNELIARITDNLLNSKSAFSPENQKIIQEIIHELRANQDNSLWDEFEVHFTRVHSSFYEKLQEKFPNLTSNEKRLCAFLRLQMSTKEISTITHQSVNSITVARSRLRKKLNIEGEDIHLINFLMKL